MNIREFMEGKKITDEDIAQLKRNREGNPYLNSMEQMTSDNGKIMQFVLGGKMPKSETVSEEDTQKEDGQEK